MKHPNILVVEDESIVALGIKKRLQNLGYTVPAVASSGEEAINKAASTFPNIILMDIMLKGEMDGVEAARQIREKFDIPIIYLTAYSDDEMLDRAKETKPYGYLLKPFEEGELLASIQIALSKHKIEKFHNNLNFEM